ncbi:hypothetical protein RchiOBHm_Chr1g0355481 [Rosa chinensis]|uniref:Uncharacterized protein n=1 Tax=Rosa chinensis TaxID=74649 RepID=A0A2P6SHD1_ROSCH|nr:hypothetical protein RchiOBHm_Chr6g0298861 [Rosa chinensis]PRQ58095.1 hypothetical protein RchiOBHm_Chr1g0355481 [Rosa chinensis]
MSLTCRHQLSINLYLYIHVYIFPPKERHNTYSENFSLLFHRYGFSKEVVECPGIHVCISKKNWKIKIKISRYIYGMDIEVDFLLLNLILNVDIA